MFDSMKQLEKLTRDSFKGAAYEAAVSPRPTQPTNTPSD